MPDVYVSVDVEADGPVPGQNSMLSVGACVAGFNHGRGFERANPSKRTFYRELKPLVEAKPDLDTARWLEEQGLEFPHAISPNRAMHHFRAWIVESKFRAHRPVFVAYPLGFDWSFVHYYFERFCGPRQDPFGFSGHLDMKTLYTAKAGCTVDRATKGRMPKHLTLTEHRHTHNALDDAKGQADLFANLMEWEGP